MESQKAEPPSPGVSPVELKDCIEELLQFTLASAVNGTLGVDVGLSKDYCSNLLKDDPNDPFRNTTELSEGVPSHPLYKHLASALYHSISTGALCKTYNKISLIHEDSSLKQKDYECNKLVMEKGFELVNMLKTVDFEIHVQEPFFSQLKDGLKTIEGRCAVGDYNRIASGAWILLNKCLVLQVQDVHRYASFCEMLEAESLSKVLPGVKTIEEGTELRGCSEASGSCAYSGNSSGGTSPSKINSSFIILVAT